MQTFFLEAIKLRAFMKAWFLFQRREAAVEALVVVCQEIIVLEAVVEAEVLTVLTVLHKDKSALHFIVSIKP